MAVAKARRLFNLAHMIVVPARMGQLNKRALVGRLQQVGSASRADLARLLGTSQPTAGKIADELLAAGILEEIPEQPVPGAAEKTKNRLGRPGRLLQLDDKRSRFLAVQLGISESCVAALPLRLANEDRWDATFPTPGSAEAWLAQLRKATGHVGKNDFWGVLVSVPGIVDERSGRVLFSPNLHWTEKVDLPALLNRAWKAPVLLVQEERALALGHHAAVSADEDFLLVDFGEGVGGAVVVGGKTYTGPLPISGELGHTPVLGNWRLCGCGAVGCVETLVSTRGLLQSFALAAPKSSHTWSGLVEHIAVNGVTDWLAEALNAAAVAISGALNVLGLRRVVITGSITELPAASMEHLARSVVKGAMWARFGEIQCVSAPRRRTAGLGAVGIDQLVVPISGRGNHTEPKQNG
jgi:predicted NBD/HSP70 family sugar kinase